MKNEKQQPKRIWYIDNLRVVLSLLVVAHHWAIANGGPGDWYLGESATGMAGTLLLSQFVATNQAFFMGFFFLISGYMVPGSFARKGPRIFVKDRLIRLGIPLLGYTFLLSPLVNYLAARFGRGYHGGLFLYLRESEGLFSPGPLWFVQLLLVFSLLYVLFRLAFRSKSRPQKPPSRLQLVLILVLLMAGTFGLRIVVPVGYWAPIAHVQPAHLLQYILCFGIGIAAGKDRWLGLIGPRTAWRAFGLGQFLILVCFPLMFLLSGKSDEIEVFMGGPNPYNLMYVCWEQAVAFCLIIGLSGLFRLYFNTQSTLMKDLSQHAYAIYVLHPLALVPLSALFLSFGGNTLHKFILLLVPALLLSYLLAKLFRRLPGMKSVL